VLGEPVRGSLPPPDFYSLPGIEQARAWLRGSLPATPLARLVGYRPTQVGSGSATLTMAASPWLQFGEGTVDLKILIEEAMGVAVLTGSPPATFMATAAMSVNHFRPCTVESESFVARARVLNSGSAYVTAEAVVEDALGRAVAQATGAILLRAIDPPPPPHRGFAPVEEPTYPTPDPHHRPGPSDEFMARDGTLLDAMRGVLRNEVPEAPVGRLLGIKYLDVPEDGSGTLSLSASPWLRSRWTDLQSGPIGTLMHTGLSVALVALVKPNTYLGVVSQSLTFLRPIPADGRDLVARYRLVDRGGELIVSSIEVLDADGNRVAMGSQTSVLRERQRRGASAAREAERVLATVLFTDIVGSTLRAQELGDAQWRRLLAEHDAMVRLQLRTFKGREVKATGDGFLAAFDSPARAHRQRPGRHRRPRGFADPVRGGAGRDPGLEHGPRPRRRFRPLIRRPRAARAQGHQRAALFAVAE